MEVRREDQDKINTFSRLHQRETTLEEQLKAKEVIHAGYNTNVLALSFPIERQRRFGRVVQRAGAC